MRPSAPLICAAFVAGLLPVRGSGAGVDERPPVSCELQKVGTDEESRFLAASVSTSVFRRCDSGIGKDVILHFAPDDLTCRFHDTPCPGRAAIGFSSCLSSGDFRSYWLPEGESWWIEDWSGERIQAARLHLTEGGAPGSERRRSLTLELDANDQPRLNGAPLAAIQSPLLKRLLATNVGNTNFCGSGPPFNVRSFQVHREEPCSAGPWECGRHRRFAAVASCKPPFDYATYELPPYFRWKPRVRGDLGGNDFRVHDPIEVKLRRESEAAATSILLPYSAAWPAEDPKPRDWWRWIDLDVHISPTRGVVSPPKVPTPNHGQVVQATPARPRGPGPWMAWQRHPGDASNRKLENIPRLDVPCTGSE